MKQVPYNPKLKTIEAGPRMVRPLLSQDDLDARIRMAAKPEAVEDMTNETPTYQYYSLSNGAVLRINKRTGEVTRTLR